MEALLFVLEASLLSSFLARYISYTIKRNININYFICIMFLKHFTWISLPDPLDSSLTLGTGSDWTPLFFFLRNWASLFGVVPLSLCSSSEPTWAICVLKPSKTFEFSSFTKLTIKEEPFTLNFFSPNEWSLETSISCVATFSMVNDLHFLEEQGALLLAFFFLI